MEIWCIDDLAVTSGDSGKKVTAMQQITNYTKAYVRTSGKPFFDVKGHFLGYRGTGTDITALKRAEQALRQAQTEFAHVTRVTMLGELTVSIAHEVNQPLAGVVANAEASLRWLNREQPDLAAARRSLEWVINDGCRASDVIRRVRALATWKPFDSTSIRLSTKPLRWSSAN
jgi:signal transduction histidine kinase